MSTSPRQEIDHGHLERGRSTVKVLGGAEWRAAGWKAVVVGLLLSVILVASPAGAADLLVPMDQTQTNHLKAYGLAFKALKQGREVSWLLNYRGGSFLFPDGAGLQMEAKVMGVSSRSIGPAETARIRETIARSNMEEVLLEVPPRIAIYAPPNFQPWDDAVTLALTYAEIDFDTLFDTEVLAGELSNYDWLHLHHEDFTGQYGKFYGSFRGQPWYKQQKKLFETIARANGFKTVRELKGAVALTIKEYVLNGGFLFAMCSATDTYDIALAGLGVDFVDVPFDGTPVDPDFQSKLDDSRCLAFKDFTVYPNPLRYEFSNIDTSDYARLRGPEADYFTLFDFSAKIDPVPTMLTQDHVDIINGFMGQTTAFRKDLLKDSVIILAEVEGANEVKYLHGNAGKGTFTFYGGHDPEDYTHAVGDPPTDLDLHPNSPGYRLILNNVLFPAAKKKPQKT